MPRASAECGPSAHAGWSQGPRHGGPGAAGAATVEASSLRLGDQASTVERARGNAPEEPVEGNSTLVEFTLAPEADGTRVRVVETGFASLATTDEQRAKNHESNTEGWGKELGELREYAEKVSV